MLFTPNYFLFLSYCVFPCSILLNYILMFEFALNSYHAVVCFRETKEPQALTDEYQRVSIFVPFNLEREREFFFVFL